MIEASSLPYRQSMRALPPNDGSRLPVTVSGPVRGGVVIMIAQAPHGAQYCDIVRERLHVAMFKTVVIPAHTRLTTKSVIGFLDQLKIAGGLLVADGASGELAWDLVATARERFTGLVAIDSGHARVPNVKGVIRDRDCPAVQVDTTVLFSTKAARDVAHASRRHVHAEFRLVEVAGPRRSRHFTAQLATEIVVRALSR